MGDRILAISTRNTAYQLFESLGSNRQKRHRTRMFLVEGVQPITRALANGWTFAAVAYDRGAVLSGWAKDVLARTSGADQYAMSTELFRPLSRKNEPSELIAMLRMPAGGLERIPTAPDLLVVIVDRPSNPGNLGTIVRSCDAFGVHGVIVTGHGADPYDPVTVTASRGSLFAIPVVHVESADQIRDWTAGIRRGPFGCRLIGADEAASVDVSDVDLVPPTALLLGNEARGLSRAMRDSCDALVRIPMSGQASSLNVSMAGSILLYEVLRQRRAVRAPTSAAALESDPG